MKQITALFLNQTYLLLALKTVVESIEVDSTLPFAVEIILIEGGVLPQDAKFFTADSLRSETFMALTTN